MEPMVLLGIALGLGLALLYFLADRFSEGVVDGLFRRLGLRSGEGPLAVRAERQGDWIEVTLENRGKSPIGLAAVQARDGGGRRIFPTPYQDEAERTLPPEQLASRFAKEVLGPGSTCRVLLDSQELDSAEFHDLAVLDTGGQAWAAHGP